MQLGFENYWSMDMNGRSSGLVVVWDRSVHYEVFEDDSNHIDMHLLVNNQPVWSLTSFYGFPERDRRRSHGSF